jgi:invasion protein IalB
MKVAKVAVLVLALLAMAFSLTPLIAQTEYPDYGHDGQGGSTGGWTVTCTYDGQETLTKKTCTSGGHSSCFCP